MKTIFGEFQDVTAEGVLSVVAPRAPLVPMVFDSPHSGLQMPADFHPAVSVERVRVAADTHVDDLFESASTVGAPLLKAHFPRGFLDVNRSLLDMDTQLVAGEWPHPTRDSATAKRGMGLMWRFAWGDEPMYAAPMSVAEAEERIYRYWQRYHHHLSELLNAVYARFGRVYHLNCHSMTAVGHAISSDPAGTVRADICLGDLHGTSASKEFVSLIAETLKAEGLDVALNRPFRGAELVAAYSNPAHGRHSVQFEINRKLYMDETTRQRNAGYEALKDVLARMNRVLADYATRS